VLRIDGDRGQLLPFGPLFLECNTQGQILWMSAQARHRLGDATNLTEALPGVSQLADFLQQAKHRETVAGVFHRSSRPPVPVELSCLMRAAERVLLSVEMRERISDVIDEAVDPLAALQNRTLENYFRLLRAHQVLDSRLSRGRRNPAALITEQMERERARLA